MARTALPAVLCLAVLCLAGLCGCSAGSFRGQLADGRTVRGYEPAGYIDGSFATFDPTEPDELDLFFAPWVNGDTELRVDVDVLGMMIPLSYAQMTEGAVLDHLSYSTPYEEGAGVTPSSCEIEVLEAEIVESEGFEYFRPRLRWDVEYGVDDGSGLYLHFTATDTVSALLY